jgi:hypothetical protein
MRRLTDAQLRAKTEEFRTRTAGGEKPYAMIPEIFAVAREAMDAVVGIRSIFNPSRSADLNMDGVVDDERPLRPVAPSRPSARRSTTRPSPPCAPAPPLRRRQTSAATQA